MNKDVVLVSLNGNGGTVVQVNDKYLGNGKIGNG